MTSRTRPLAPSRLLSNNVPAAKTANPRTPADPPAVPDAKTTCSPPTAPSEAVTLLSTLGYMLETDTINRNLITKVLTSVANMAGLTNQAANVIYAVIQLLPPALDIGIQLEFMTSALAEISKKAEAAERAAEESKLTVMSFVEQQGICRAPTHPQTTTESTIQRSKTTQPHPNLPQDQKLPPDAIERCKFRAASVYVQPSEQHRHRIEMLDNQALLDRAAATFELAWAAVKDTDFVRSLGLRNQPKPRFVSAKHLPNGTVLYQLSHRKYALFLSQAPIARAFEQNFGFDITFRGQQAEILLEGFPLKYDPCGQTLISTLENSFQMQPGSILSCSWAKPISARTPGQKRAAVRVVLRSQDDADDLIARPGAELDNSKFIFRRLEEDPIRCLRCQKFGHKSTDCRSPQDICRQCGGKHRSSACDSPGTTRCANCGSDEHASWFRKCPEFEKARIKFNKRRPENRRPFFDHTRAFESAEPIKDTPESSSKRTLPSDSKSTEQHQNSMHGHTPEIGLVDDDTQGPTA
ncbi:hypothetical protein RhiJN_21102 [Ceratobasidium sp. AG-Ba]|nr:hypothetical protein RhiJN_10381 [Ceratobasidium sp. AG-Ba]QRV93084.1 hypothetical protein RhiJN_21102 [Ceratobasidium sp. AG-Ba]